MIMKMTMVERQPPPHFQAAAPARHPRKGPSIVQLPPAHDRDALAEPLEAFPTSLQPKRFRLHPNRTILYRSVRVDSKRDAIKGFAERT
jgi:hypothetical protein